MPSKEQKALRGDLTRVFLEDAKERLGDRWTTSHNSWLTDVMTVAAEEILDQLGPLSVPDIDPIGESPESMLIRSIAESAYTGEPMIFVTKDETADEYQPAGTDSILIEDILEAGYKTLPADTLAELEDLELFAVPLEALAPGEHAFILVHELEFNDEDWEEVDVLQWAPAQAISANMTENQALEISQRTWELFDDFIEEHA